MRKLSIALLFVSAMYAQAPFFTASVMTGTVANPSISPNGGAVPTGQTISITTSTPSATICYTSDGSTPTIFTPGSCPVGSTTYSGSFTISPPVTIKAVATKAGYSTSSVVSASFTLLWTFGVDFRATSSYVTDQASMTYSLGENYPTTRGGQTFGWTHGSINTRDRSTSVDTRLSGTNFNGTANDQAVFELDLTPGTYTLRLAVGDQGSQATHSVCAIYDDTTLLKQVTNDVVVPAGSFADANGSVWTAAQWPGSNTPFTVTLSSTTASGGKSKLLIKLGSTAVVTATAIAHLEVSQ